MRGAYREAIEGYKTGIELDESPSSTAQVFVDLDVVLE